MAGFVYDTCTGVVGGSCGDVFLTLWSGAATVENTRWMNDHIRKLMAQNPGGVVVLMLILPSSTPPGGQAREEAKSMLKEAGKKMRRMVTVPLGDALWSSVVRTIMRAMFMMSGQSASHVVAATEDEGLVRLSDAASPATPEMAALRSAVARMRELQAQGAQAPASA